MDLLLGFAFWLVLLFVVLALCVTVLYVKQEFPWLGNGIAAAYYWLVGGK